MKKSLAVAGFHDGSAGQVSGWIEENSTFKICCYFSPEQFPKIEPKKENKKRVSQRMEYPSENHLYGKPMYWGSEWLENLKKHNIKYVLPLEANNHQRLKIIKICKANGLRLASAIHPTCIIDRTAQVAKGVWINARAFVGFKAEISEGVIVNTGSIIEHHNVLKQCSQIDPGVTTTGNCTVMKCGHIHTGATLINKCIIGENSIVGAGALVRKNVKNNNTVVGIPAKILIK